MNGLDKRIAELKGWRIVPLQQYIEMTGREPSLPQNEYVIRDVAPRAINVLDAHDWSTSDAKAFELVDEIDHHFALERGLSSDTEAWEWEWRAGFMLGAEIRMHVAPTRPEAICRAYIAAREWMTAKGEG